MAAKIDYTVQKGETTDAYNARIAAARGETGGGSGSTPAPDSNGAAQDPFIAELTKTLMKQSGMVSSADSNIEASINDAIKGVKGANDASTARITSEYDRNKGYQMDLNQNSEQNFFESRGGYATPVVAFGALREYNAKTIKDLDQRKNELILAGDAAAAGKIADLQVQKLSFEQEAAQRTFSNLLSIGGFALNVKSNQLAEKAQTFQESQAKSAIALQYGLKMEPGDTLDSLVTKAMPLASEEQKLKLEQLRANIRESNAQTQKALNDAKSGGPLDAASIAALAAAYRTPNGAAIVAASVKDPATLSKIFAGSASIEQNDVKSYVQGKIAEGATFEDTLKQMQSDPSITINDFNGASKIAADLYAAKPAVAGPRVTNFPTIAGSGLAGYSGGVNSFLEWLTSVPQAGKYNK